MDRRRPDRGRTIASRAAQGAATVAAGLVLALQTGCATSKPKRLPRALRKYAQPTVAVLAFDNKAWFPLKWNIGQGVRDILVDELVKSGCFSVVTRADLGAVLTELDIQSDAHFRKQGRAAKGKLKNVQYLIKGAVTDFSHVAGGGLRAVVIPYFWFGGRGSYAVMSVTLYVISIETGEIVASESLEGRAYAGSMDLQGTYKRVSIGGDAFYRTPLGRATKQVVEEAVERISVHVAREKWRPRIAKVYPDGKVLLSGGVDRALKTGSVWGVYKPGEKILDPATGDLLGSEPPTRIALLKVVNVQAKLSEAEVLQGKVEIGLFCQPANKTAGE